ncbi:hypothetical protein F5Y19DRAFT_176822 [Xylariaceae sp. FL1651]|nr:hypothetical protein F5Y19DRAFT_176822 [Xylariaceae sp. FL1651]
MACFVDFGIHAMPSSPPSPSCFSSPKHCGASSPPSLSRCPSSSSLSSAYSMSTCSSSSEDYEPLSILKKPRQLPANDGEGGDCGVAFERSVTFDDPIARDIITGAVVSPSPLSRQEWTAKMTREFIERNRAAARRDTTTIIERSFGVCRIVRLTITELDAEVAEPDNADERGGVVAENIEVIEEDGGAQATIEETTHNDEETGKGTPEAKLKDKADVDDESVP